MDLGSTILVSLTFFFFFLIGGGCFSNNEDLVDEKWALIQAYKAYKILWTHFPKNEWVLLAGQGKCYHYQ